jgi:hypothetical protein
MRTSKLTLAFLFGTALALSACGNEQPADHEPSPSGIPGEAPVSSEDLSNAGSVVSAGVGEAAVYGPGGTLCSGRQRMLRKVERAGEEAPPWLRRDIAKCDFYAYPEHPR